MRVYRVLRGPVATQDDFQSLADVGRPIPHGAPAQVRRKWEAVSTFTTIELARKRARDRRLGNWWAAIELPPEVMAEEDPPVRLGRHVSVYGVTADQLLGYIAETGRFEPEGRLQ